MACNVVLPQIALGDGTLDIVSKFTTLTQEALGTDSTYMRAKDTFKELLDANKINQDTYAQLAGQFVSQLAVETTKQVLQSAIQWAVQEKEMAYSLAQSKAQTELIMAQREKVAADICLAQKELELKCAQITATIAGSIRDNGRVATSDINNPCVPLTLQPEGTKYTQEQFIESQQYANLADAFRKSGVVAIGTDTDSVTKGMSGDNTGYTDSQEEFARRQVKSFEDSKRNHAVNAMSQMVGQMLSSEVAPTVEDITRWRTGIDYLLTTTP